MKWLLLFLWPFCLQAQSPVYNFSKVEIEDGLSNNHIYTIYRDDTGFVWFGTASGLNRFDGYNCRIFVNNPHDSTSLEA